EGVALCGEQHEVGLLMSGCAAVVNIGGPLGQPNTAFNQACGAAAFAAAEAAPALGTRQVMPPTIVFGATALGVNEAIDSLITDHSAARLAGEPPGDLLWRPSLSQPLQHRL